MGVYVCVCVCRPVIAQDFLEALKVVRPYSAMSQKQRSSRKRAKNDSPESDCSHPITPLKDKDAPTCTKELSRSGATGATLFPSANVQACQLDGARAVAGAAAQHVHCHVKQEHTCAQMSQS